MILIGCILVSVLLVIIESLKGLPSFLTTPFVIMEYLFTAFFTFEYLTRIYCSPRPRKYIFSFFGIVDLLATLPLYIGLLFPGARYEKRLGERIFSQSPIVYYRPLFFSDRNTYLLV